MKTKIFLPLILLSVASGIGSLVMFWKPGGNVMWLGAAIAVLPLPLLLMVVTNFSKKAGTNAKLPIIQALSLGGLATVIATIYSQQIGLTEHAIVALAIAAFGAIFAQWFIRVFSKYGRKKSGVIVRGQALPKMSFTRLNGSIIDSDSFTGSKTLLVFFRANWCPFCMNQLKEVIASVNQLKKNSVQVKFISNQGIERSKQLEEKLNLAMESKVHQPTGFEILQDNDLRVARTLGIEDIGGAPAMPGYPPDTVMATVIALDEDGNVLFGDETDNYRVRPHPSTFLHVFNK